MPKLSLKSMIAHSLEPNIGGLAVKSTSSYQ